MNCLHLFAGIGGCILADKILGFKTIGAVEIEPYCRAVLKQRQEEGLLEEFPIFEDVRTFNGDEINDRIDCVCGGFPCQDISCTGKGKGVEGEKSGLFFELIRICRNTRPQYIFLENSPFITTRGLDTVLKEIAAIGYDAEWSTLSAGAFGAPHRRERWWAVCQRQGTSGTRSLVERIGNRFSRLCKEFNGRTHCNDYKDFRGGRIPTPTRHDMHGPVTTKTTYHKVDLPTFVWATTPNSVGMKLSPTFVEWLMNFPIEWTALKH